MLFLLTDCSVYRAVEEGSSISAGIGDKFEELMGHFSEKELLYFREWHNMVSLEIKAQTRKVSMHKIWTTSPAYRYWCVLVGN